MKITHTKQPIKNISVIGDGGWGSTLAIHLVKNSYAVKLWGPFPEYVRKMKKNRYNPKFLPGIQFPKTLTLEEDLKTAITESELIVFAIPSQYTPGVLKHIKKLKLNLSDKIFLSVTKGIDNDTLLRMSELIYKGLGKINLAVLSGPTIASEVAKGIPSTAVIASDQRAIAQKIQKVFNSETFRIYTNTDIIGTELGGSIKNIIALACGVCDGLGFGSNTKAALLTRGLAEMTRLGKAMGGKSKTFSGLTGLGDLVTTCFSPKSRNRTVGEQLGKGKSIKTIMASMEMVAEGVETVKAAYKLSQKLNVPMPITTEIYKIIYNNKKPAQAVADLMKREMKAE
ncbi:Glycerol-3-phosphate dehydrogenase [NAD(P)+] [hydrothermal vent metagenome]|uniref:Glycerol-3-phosphate dehydrogenase [NAD(P)+] n=1 Tax=hydrothermal vent metagenome TaxID=652676 RepID=A0A3B1D6S9_9ZZZZ